MPRHAPFVAALLLAAPVAAADKPLPVLDRGAHATMVRGTFFTPDGTRLITTSTDKTVRIWDVATGDCLHTLHLPLDEDFQARGRSGIESAALSPDGALLAVDTSGYGSDERVFVLQLASSAVLWTSRPRNRVHSLAFSPDSKLLAIGEEKSTIQVVGATDGTARFTLRSQTQGHMLALAFSPDGKRLASGDHEGSVRLWSLATRAAAEMPDATGGFLRNLAWSPEGATLAGLSSGGRLRLWDLPTGKLRTHTMRGGDTDGLAFFSDGKRLLAGANLVDTATGIALAEVTAAGEVRAVGISPDGTRAAFGGLTQLTVWDVLQQKVLYTRGSRAGGVAEVSWSPDGGRVAWRYAGDLGGASRWRSFDFATLRLGGPPDTTFVGGKLTNGDVSLHRTKQALLVKRGTGPERALQIVEGVGGYRFQTMALVGKKYAAPGYNSGVFLYDTETGTLKHRYKGVSRVYTLAGSPDGRYFAVSGEDQIIRICSPERNQQLLALYARGEDWVAWTPEGYYAASPAGERLLGWQVNQGHDKLALFHTADQFRESLYRPGALRNLLKRGSTKEALEAADKQEGKQSQATEVDEALPPRVVIESVDRSQLPRVVVKAKAQGSGKHPVTALRLLIDGRPYEGSRGFRNVRGRGAGDKTETWEAVMPPGTHQLAVVAESAVSRATSEAVEVTVAAPSKPSLFVLAIGINNYGGDWKLRAAVSDARELARTFQQRSKTEFAAVETRVMVDRTDASTGEKAGMVVTWDSLRGVEKVVTTDKAATRDGILSGLAWLQEKMPSHSHNTAILFYAGHGLADEQGRFSLTSVDWLLGREAKTLVSGDELKQRLADLPGRVVLMLDACHSGAVGAVRVKAPRTDTLVRELTSEDCGVAVLVAARPDEESLENDRHGFFTQALLDGLRDGKADVNPADGVIRLSELLGYVEYHGAELSGDKQHPMYDKPLRFASFPLARIAKGP